MGGFTVNSPIKGDDPAKGGSIISVKGLFVGLGKGGGLGDTAGVGMFENGCGGAIADGAVCAAVAGSSR